jgi:hypothetical protein
MWLRARAKGEARLPSLDGYWDQPAVPATPVGQAARREQVQMLIQGGGQGQTAVAGALRQEVRQTKAGAKAEQTLGNRKTALKKWWSEFAKVIGIPEVLLVQVEVHEEMKWVSESVMMFMAYIALYSKGWDGVGLSLETTPWTYANVVIDAHFMMHKVDLTPLKQETRTWAQGRAVDLVNLRGVRMTDKKQGFTLEMYQDWEKIGWSKHEGTKNPARRTKLFQVVYRVAASAFFRSQSFLWVRRPFHPKWHLTWGSVEWFNLMQERVEPTAENLARLKSEGGYCALTPPPCKNDRVGKLMSHLKVLMQLNQPGRGEGDAMWAWEMEVQCWGEARATTALFLDPETADETHPDGQWLRKDLFIRVIRVQTLDSLHQLHARKDLMEDIEKAYSSKSFRIGSENVYETMGATEADTCGAGRWKDGPSKSQRQYSRTEVRRKLRLQNKAAVTHTSTMHTGALPAYPSRYAANEEPPALGDPIDWSTEFPTTKDKRELLGQRLSQEFYPPEDVREEGEMRAYWGTITDLFEDEGDRWVTVVYDLEEGEEEADREDMTLDEFQAQLGKATGAAKQSKGKEAAKQCKKKEAAAEEEDCTRQAKKAKSGRPRGRAPNDQWGRPKVWNERDRTWQSAP